MQSENPYLISIWFVIAGKIYIEHVVWTFSYKEDLHLGRSSFLYVKILKLAA